MFGILRRLISNLLKEGRGSSGSRGNRSRRRARQEKEAQLKQERIRAQQLERVEEAFRNLKKQKATLDAKLLTALGGPDEYATYSVYRNLLAEMIQNRQQAQALGSRSAEQEMQASIARLQKLQQ